MGFEAIQRAIDKYAESVRTEARRVRAEVDAELDKEIKVEVAKKLSPAARKMVYEGFTTAVDAWYAAFTPTVYKRTNINSGGHTLDSVLRFDDNTDGVITWSYYDDGLNKKSLYDPGKTYNIYSMAMERGSHGNRLRPFYLVPYVSESPLARFRRDKSAIEEKLQPDAQKYAQEYYDKNYLDRFRQKWAYR